METYFTSDTHFGHRNIIKYSNRPFPWCGDNNCKSCKQCREAVEEMDETMINNWNEVVGKHDHIWHLGDYAFAPEWRMKQIHDRLNGKKHLLLGNHDDHNKMRAIWEHVGSYRELRIDKTFVVLCHYAMRVWNKSHRGSLMLYGHSHGTLPGTSQSLDVGVDCWDFKPVNLEQIKERMKTLEEYIKYPKGGKRK